MTIRKAFVDDCEAAKDFASGDIVRKTDFRDFFPSPYAGRVVYSDPRNGTVQVQWPWGSEQESPTALIKDMSGSVAVPLHLNQTYDTWRQERLTNDKETLKQDAKWRSKLSSESSTALLDNVIIQYEERTKPLWRAACKAHYYGLNQIQAFQRLSAYLADVFGSDAIRITVSNLYSVPEHLSRRLAIYWKDTGRRYKVTQREKASGILRCPRCGQNSMRPRVYRQGKKVLQCRACGFAISPKDLIWDQELETVE
jgi:predicted RNA-binding Zn-ribbon protein involved in translation (DUF1610 family)